MSSGSKQLLPGSTFKLMHLLYECTWPLSILSPSAKKRIPRLNAGMYPLNTVCNTMVRANNFCAVLVTAFESRRKDLPAMRTHFHAMCACARAHHGRTQICTPHTHARTPCTYLVLVLVLALVLTVLLLVVVVVLVLKHHTHVHAHMLPIHTPCTPTYATHACTRTPAYRF